MHFIYLSKHKEKVLDVLSCYSLPIPLCKQFQSLFLSLSLLFGCDYLSANCF